MSPPYRDRKAFVLLNPRAGIGSARHLRYRIERELRPLAPEVVVLGEGDDLRGLVLDAVRRGANEIVVAGGDGSVSAVADAVVGTGAVLGIVPTGTTNMLAKELGIPSSVELAARTVRERSAVVKIDAVHNGERHFIYQVVFGFGADVSSRITSEERYLLGASAHLTAGLRQLPDHRPLRVTGTVDGRSLDGEAHQVIVANAGVLGMPPFRLGPGIRPDDGKVEVIALTGRSRLDILNMGMSMLRGSYQHSGLLYLDARTEIVLDADRRSAVKADGDIIGTTPLHLCVVPGAVDVIVPRTRGKG